MKKIIIITFGLLICLQANSQVKLGLRGGALLSSLDYKINSSSINTENIIKYQLGIQLNAKMGTVLGFNTGLFYSAKGSDLEIASRNGEMKIDYIDIPAIFEARLGSGKVNAFIEGGASFSFAFNGTFDDGVSEKDIKFGEGQNEISYTDYAAVLGGGINLGKLRVGLNYNMGLKDISNSSVDEIKNRNVLLYATFFFK